MISGVKRKSTAKESTLRFFQTIDLIISHFKRDADKKKIYELIDSESYTLKDLLVATASIHLYHNLGIRVQDSLNASQISSSSTFKIEMLEKKDLIKEIDLILKDSFKMEIDMLKKTMEFENSIISFLIEERMTKLQKFERDKKLKKLEDEIEENLMDIILNYPPYYFFDLLGDLIGGTEEIKMEILEEGSAFKDLSVDIEKKLEREEKEDKFIEISTLNHIIDRLKKRFEFKSYRELQVEAMPVRMIKKEIMAENLDRYPVSIPGLNCFVEANKTKEQILDKIEEAFNKKIRYDDFEESIVSFLKKVLIEHLKTNPNDFIYFLQGLNESNFSKIMYLLNKYGVYNLLNLIEIDEEIIKKIEKNMIRYNIDKFDFMVLNDEKRDYIYRAKKEICNLDMREFKNVLEGCQDLSDQQFETMVFEPEFQNSKIWGVLKERLEINIADFKEYLRKKKVIKKVFLDNLGLRDYSQIIFLLDFNNVIENIAKDIYYFIFSKIIRQLSRIIELYSKISNEKALFLLSLKKMQGTTESEKWVWIKLEDLLIKRIINLQNQLVIIFNALNEPFLVNGFIFARLTDTSLNNAIEEFKNEDSYIYDDIKSLSLSSEIISPVSYCIAYDLIKRFESHEELRKLRIEQIIQKKKEATLERKEQIKKKQQENTFNWIERRITSSIMRVNSPGINPNQLYWKEKDTKNVTDSIKLHSEVGNDPIALFRDYFNFCVEKMRELYPGMKLPPKEKLNQMVLNIIHKTLSKRLGDPPTKEEISQMMDGERFEISKQIAIRIGKLLDKTLYTKFKDKK